MSANVPNNDCSVRQCNNRKSNTDTGIHRLPCLGTKPSPAKTISVPLDKHLDPIQLLDSHELDRERICDWAVPVAQSSQRQRVPF